MALAVAHHVSDSAGSGFAVAAVCVFLLYLVRDKSGSGGKR